MKSKSNEQNKKEIISLIQRPTLKKLKEKKCQREVLLTMSGIDPVQPIFPKCLFLDKNKKNQKRKKNIVI